MPYGTPLWLKGFNPESALGSNRLKKTRTEDSPSLHKADVFGVNQVLQEGGHQPELAPAHGALRLDEVMPHGAAAQASPPGSCEAH